MEEYSSLESDYEVFYSADDETQWKILPLEIRFLIHRGILVIPMLRCGLLHPRRLRRELRIDNSNVLIPTPRGRNSWHDLVAYSNS